MYIYNSDRVSRINPPLAALARACAISAQASPFGRAPVATARLRLVRGANWKEALRCSDEVGDAAQCLSNNPVSGLMQNDHPEDPFRDHENEKRDHEVGGLPPGCSLEAG